METTYFTVMGSQALPWPGKRALRREVARLEVRQAELALERVRLSLEAAVRRVYIDLLLTRDRLRLLESQEGLWKRAEEVTRIRYKVGEGAQSDLLRTQLELNRLKQRRWSLEAEERAQVAAMNRLRGRPLDEPVPTTVRLEQLGDPSLSSMQEAIAASEAKSPELMQARTGVSAAGQQLELARKERYPDFAVSAGVMPRGALEPMWQAGVSVNLPVYSGQKQRRAVAESEARQRADAHDQESIRQLLQLRVKERYERLEALLQANRLYRDGLLVLSEATTQSTLSQYAVGRVPFASVLETVNGNLADRERYLESIAQAWRIAIAQEEVSLAPVAGAEAGMTGASMPGAGGGPVAPPRRTGAGGTEAGTRSAGGMSM
jgi:outer membrane protein TolC